MRIGQLLIAVAVQRVIMAVMVEEHLYLVFGTGDEPAVAVRDLVCTDAAQQTQRTIARLRDAAHGEQSVAAMEHTARYQPFVDKIGQQPVAECLGPVIALQSVLHQPCRLVAGVARQIALPQGGVPFLHHYRNLAAADLLQHTVDLVQKMPGEIPILTQNRGRRHLIGRKIQKVHILQDLLMRIALQRDEIRHAAAPPHLPQETRQAVFLQRNARETASAAKLQFRIDGL